jgi:hypothetical protein
MNGLMMNCLRLKRRYLMACIFMACIFMACIFAVATSAHAPIVEPSNPQYMVIYVASEMVLRFAMRSGIKVT